MSDRTGGDDDVEMLRRDFLAAAAFVGGQLFWERLSLAQAFNAQYAIGPPLIDALSQTTRELTGQANWAPPHQTLGKLAGLSVLVTEMAERYSPHQADLFQIVAHIEAVRGLVTHQLGKTDRARYHLGLAEGYAKRVEDGHLRALIRVWRSDIDSAVQAGRWGGSGPQVLDTLLGAARLADTTSRAGLRTYIAMRLAEEYAAIGQHRNARLELDVAHNAFGAIQGGNGDLYGMTWTERPTLAFAANVYLLLGEHDDAAMILREVIDRSQPGASSDRIAAMTDLAAAMAQLGELGEACQLLTDAYELASTSGRQDRAVRITGVVEHHLDRWATEPEVQRLHERLAS